MLQRDDSGVSERSLSKQSGFGLHNNYFYVIYPLGLYVLTLSLAILVAYLHTSSSIIKLFIVPGISLIIINHFFRERPIRFALSLCAVMLASISYTGDTDRTLHVARNFFGT